MGDVEAVEVFWRPGCGFCSMLLRGLERRAIPVSLRNIWEEPAAAEFVRSVNRGNETVPTVRIGDAVLTNPSAEQVERVVGDHAPHLLRR